uniref:MYND-type domain-containing protein n=1 Tax=Panagrolaimus sp. ES5 TaxID=591445 RepID=A0AC34FW20_9BILA
MHFKASQKLLNPNQQNSQSKNEFEKLKEKANKFFQEEKYNEAVKAYTEILQLSELSSENRATIFSNRSASNLMLESHNSLKMAKSDAEEAIKLWPSWWKGYFRLARVQMKLEEWFQAEETLEKTLALNSELKEIRDELSFVRSTIGKIHRGRSLSPGSKPRTKEESEREICERLGISRSAFQKIERDAPKFPMFEHIIQAHKFRDGIEFRQDYKKAAEHYAKAAELGNPEGMYNLGKLYHDGNGVKRDYAESMKLYLKAANSKPINKIMVGSGISEAQHAIGLNYMEGVGVEKDYQKAAEWFEKAVKNGFGASANNLGCIYRNGLGVQRSPLKAFNYYKFAAGTGDTAAMMNLSDCYFDGEGTAKNDAQGQKWLQLAAKKGDLRAAMKLRMRQSSPSGNDLSEMFRQLIGGPRSQNNINEGASPLERIKADPKRKTLILQHRELFIQYAEQYGTSGINIPATIPKPPHTPNPPNWSSPLKKITLSDMDPTKDKVYNGCVLEVRIIDWSILICSIQTKIEDEKGDVNRFAIYNWPLSGVRNHDVLEIMKIFRPNVKISIINPYHRRSRDGQNTIRVEGPQYIRLDNSMIDKQCHVCGKEAKILPCSTCKMAFYCSKDCQKLDWIEFNHKNLCKHLKMYAELM